MHGCRLYKAFDEGGGGEEDNKKVELPTPREQKKVSKSQGKGPAELVIGLTGKAQTHLLAYLSEAVSGICPSSSLPELPVSSGSCLPPSLKAGRQ